ncbi:MAG: hypothetical protein ACI8SE_000909 [Bacteroidia bacterium]|jgi:hypothetical protein
MNITIGSLITLVVAGLLIRFATKFLLKLVGWVLIIGLGIYALYHFGVGPFEQNPISIQTWESKYCDNQEDMVTCDCIVNPIKNDLESRFTVDELLEIEKDRAQLLYVVQRSFTAVKPQIQRCLGNANAENALENFKNDLIPVDNDVLEEIKRLADSIKEGAQNQLDEFTSKKESLDSKYED